MERWRPGRDEPPQHGRGAGPHDEGRPLAEDKERHAGREDEHKGRQDEAPARRRQPEGPPALRVRGRQIGQPQTESRRPPTG